MADAKHTPGPWAVGERRQVLVPQKCGLLVAQVAKGSVASSVGSFSIDEAEAQANANLIAAAPDLLAELDVRVGDLFMLRKAIEAGDPKKELLFRIDDMLRETKLAIAKAEGRQ